MGIYLQTVILRHTSDNHARRLAFLATIPSKMPNKIQLTECVADHCTIHNSQPWDLY
jgi:hypothetical protein